MYGQPNTPFGGGGGGFGQPTNTAPVFGSPAPAPGGIFGSPAPGWQQPQTTGQTAFGQQAPAPSGFGGGFAPASAPTSLFGAPAPAQTGFGGFGGAPATPASGLFGAAPTSTFGSTPGGLFGTSAAPAFGAAPAPTVFGQTSASGGLFGQTPAPTSFGAQASNFNTPSTFGSAPASSFGVQAPSAGLFGASTPAFGAPAPSTGLFGSNQAQAPFGASSPSPTGLFGSSQAQPSGFGTTSLFGSSPAPLPSGFGAPVGGGAGIFGAPASTTSAIGTRATPYQVTSRQDGTSSINLQSISAMQQYQDQSHEELRFADYSQGNRGTAAPTPSAYGGYGAAPAAPAGLFGAAPTSTFGSTTGGLFGTSAATAFGGSPAPTAFGQTPASGGLFGQTPAPTSFGAQASNFSTSASTFGSAPSSSFGVQAPSTGLFGASTPAFGAPAPSTGLFGSSQAQAPFGASSPPTGLFGSNQAQASGFGSTSLFGSSTAPAPFGSTAPAPGFFGQAPAGGGLFGPTPAPAPSMFGSAPAQAFGAPAQGGIFGSSAPTPAFGSPYAQAPPVQYQYQQPQPLFASNAQIVAPGVNEVIEQQMRAMDNQLNDLKKMEVWKGHRASTSPATTPTSLHDTESFFSPTPRPGALAYSTSRSAAKIRPRGFAQTEPPKPTVPLSSTRRDNSGLMSPEAYVRSSQLNLVIRPDSLQRARKFGLQLESHGPPNPLGLLSETIQPPPTEESPANVPRTDPTPSPLQTQDVGASASSLRDAPATSPGYEYYQQVIGNTNDGSNQPDTPAANGTPNGLPWYVPKLTKSGYEVSPSINELATKSEADLASMRKFTVMRPGYGKVEWEGSVDVRGADLDSIVVIEDKDVSVYNLDEEKGSKPEEGTKLNRSALITFYEVFPKEGARASAEVKEKFAKKVEKATQRMDAEFVSYDSDAGVWKIRVQHFSRFALVDDSDDENTLESYADAPLEATPQQPKSHARRKATPYRLNQDLEMLESTEYEENDTNMVHDADLTDMDVMEYSRLEAEQAARAIVDATKEDVSSLQRRQEVAEDVTFEDEGEDGDSSIAEPYCVAEAQSSRDDLLQAISGSSICSALSGKAKTDPSHSVCGSRMGRSFRVGWLPDGSFLKLSISSNPLTPLLIKARPVLSDDSAKATAVALLEAQRKNAILHSRGEDNCPLFSLSRNCEHTASAFPGDEDAKHAFLLLSRIFPVDGDIHNLATSDQEIVPLESRRMAAVFNLLLALCAPDVSKAVNSQSDYLSKVFAALSGGNLEFACGLAAEAGFTLLAVAMATSVDGRKDIRRLLLDVAESGDLSRLTNPVALRILRDAGGEFKWEDKFFRDGDKTLDWRRRLVLRVLQDPDTSLLEALKRYESDTAHGTVPFPHPRYLEGTTSQVESLFFRLLHLCADPQTMSVCEAIDPSGYTSFLHDFYLSFHLVSAISAISSNLNVPFMLSAFEVEYIMDGYETQLTLQGTWEWAVFVSLCHIGEGAPDIQRWKTKRAKDLVIRHFHDGDRQAKLRRDFLERKVGVPSLWFEEALCYRAAAVGDDVGCIGHAIKFSPRFGREAFVEFVLPRFVFHKKVGRKTSMIANMASELPPDSLAMAMYRYFELDERVMDITTGVEDLPDVDEVSVLLKNFEYVHDFLSKLSDSSKSKDASHLLSNALLIPVPEKTVQLSSMVSDALQRLSLLKVQLDALSRP